MEVESVTTTCFQIHLRHRKVTLTSVLSVLWLCKWPKFWTMAWFQRERVQR